MSPVLLLDGVPGPEHHHIGQLETPRHHHYSLHQLVAPALSAVHTESLVLNIINMARTSLRLHGTTTVTSTILGPLHSLCWIESLTLNITIMASTSL